MHSFLLIFLLKIMQLLFILVKTRDINYLLGDKGIINTRRILIRRKVLRSWIHSSLINLSLDHLLLLISSLLLVRGAAYNLLAPVV